MKKIARYGLFAGLGLALVVAGCGSSPQKDDSGFVGYKDAKVTKDAQGSSYDSPPAVPAGTSVVVKPPDMTDKRFQPDPKLASAGGNGH